MALPRATPLLLLLPVLLALALPPAPCAADDAPWTAPPGEWWWTPPPPVVTSEPYSWVADASGTGSYSPETEGSSSSDGDPNMGNPVPSSYYQAHGWLMTIAFVILIPIAVASARFTQTLTSHWYTMHWALQVVALCCILPAFIIAVHFFDAMQTRHAKVGIAVACLIFVQPFVAALRPPKGVRGRMFWYILHWFLGTMALALGWFNCFGGLKLYQAMWGTSTTTLQTALLAYLCMLGFVYMFMARWDHIRDQEQSERLTQGVPRRPSVDRTGTSLPSQGSSGSLPYMKQVV